VSNIAALFYSFSVSFYILKITDNNAFISGIYLAVSGLVFCLVTLFGGVISDRFNKAKIMYICDYIKGALILGSGFLIWFVIKSTTIQLVLLFVSAVILNGIAGIFTPASGSLLPQIVEENSFQQAQSYFSVLNAFQSIVGAVIAGILYSYLPIEIIFIIVGGCYVISAISEMFIKYNSDYEKRDEKLTIGAVFGDLKEGFKYIFNLKPVLALMFCILFINFFFAPIYENFSPYFISTDVKGSTFLFSEFMGPEMWSAFFAVSIGIGSVTMGIIYSMLKQKEKCNGVVRWSVLGVAFLMICMTVEYLLFKANVIGLNVVLIANCVILLLIGVLLVLINVPSQTAMMKIVEKDKFGKVSSVTNIGSQGLIPFATFLGGVALDTIGSLGLLSICTGGFVIVALILFFNKPVREL
nr:MFS transporter [Bacilli bacterium]